SGEGLETTMVSSGLGWAMAFTSIGPEVHGAAHLFQGLARRLARLLRALGDDVAQQVGVLDVFLRAAAHLGHFGDDLVDHRLLAVEAADAGGATAFRGPFAGGLVGVDPMQVPYRTLV